MPVTPKKGMRYTPLLRQQSYKSMKSADPEPEDAPEQQERIICRLFEKIPIPSGVVSIFPPPETEDLVACWHRERHNPVRRTRILRPIARSTNMGNIQSLEQVEAKGQFQAYLARELPNSLQAGIQALDIGDEDRAPYEELPPSF